MVTRFERGRQSNASRSIGGSVRGKSCGDEGSEIASPISSWPALCRGCPVQWFCAANLPKSVACCPSPSRSAGPSLSPLAGREGGGEGQLLHTTADLIRVPYPIASADQVQRGL